MTATLPSRMRSTHAYFITALLLVVFCSVIATDGSESYAGPTQPVDAAFFGMHIHRAAAGTAWPPVTFAGWRLWDADVSWPQLEPERGKWDFNLLDRYVRIAAEQHVDILLTLGPTPAWASARPEEPSNYGKGNAAEPKLLADWEEYVRVVATRYKDVIHNYEVWNEPNVKGMFTGSSQTMLELSRAAYRILKSVDPIITVVSPSATADDGAPWLNQFVALDGCRYADVIGYHFYVTPKPPEAMLALIRKVRTSLRKHECQNKPLWNTESGWASPKQFPSEEEAAGYLIRTYILNWLMGIQRCYWYAWDNHNWSTLDLTSPAKNQMTKAGAAYGTMRDWLLGANLRSCVREPSGVWTCSFDRSGSASWIVWSDQRTQSFALPAGWQIRSLISWTGEVSTAGNSVTVGPAPVLLLRH